MPGGSLVQSLMMIALLFVLMYFLTIRPQKRKMEEDRKMRSKMKVGDKVVTIGGIRGTVTRITDDSFEIETGSDNLRIEFLTQALSYIVTPVAGMEEAAEDEEEESGIVFEDAEDQEEEKTE